MRRLACLSLLTSLSLSAAGCSDVPDHPETFPVTGTVTHGGKPVGGVSVAFVPVGGTADARGARGVTDDSGRYTLSTYFSAAADVKGAIPGEYKVTLYKNKAASGGTAAHGGDYAPGSRAAYNASRKVQSELPEKYASQDTTPLTVKVENKSNTIDLKAD